MKKLLFVLLFLPVLLFSQNNPVYSIQLGTFVNPTVKDFSLISNLGYLYADPAGNEFYRVFLGSYASEEEAGQVLATVKQRGYQAFLTKKELPEISAKPVVQFTTLPVSTIYQWEKYDRVGKLYVLLDAPGKVKLVTGPFENDKIAAERLSAIKKMGYQDAFIKKVNPVRLHEVGDFERNQTPVSKKLNEAVETILNQQPPAPVQPMPPSYEKPDMIIAKGVPAAPVRSMPAKIDGKIKRTSALDIQKLLKAQKYYTGSLDGFYGEKTGAAFDQFTRTDAVYIKYAALEQLDTKEKAVSNDFQQLLNQLPFSPATIIPALQNSKEPLAKAYLAYWKMRSGEGVVEINRLMNSAIQASFNQKQKTLKNTPPFDFSADYTYEKPEQFFLHLMYLHAAPAAEGARVPCWVFEQNAQLMEGMFGEAGKFANLKNIPLGNCAMLNQFSSLNLMRTMVKDLSPANFTEEEKQRQQSLDIARNQLYLFPTKPTVEEKQKIDVWLRNFWKQLDQQQIRFPVLAKNLNTLKILFYHSQLQLEDYFMTKEFSANEAEGLALSLLKTYVEVPMGVYKK